MTINYKQFDQKFIEDRHGQIFFYRDLYDGKHGKIFKRADDMLRNGELLANLIKDHSDVPFVRTPYIVANICKLVVNVPAMLVARSIGDIVSSLEANETQIAASNEKTNQDIEGTEDNTRNGTIENLQKELIDQIVLNSNLDSEHWSNIVQYQIDGGLVGVPINDNRGQRIEFKARDVYFPHEDDLGADIVIQLEFPSEADPEIKVNYLHVYRERIELDPAKNDEKKMGLRATHQLFLMGQGGIVEEVEISAQETADKLNMTLEDLERFYPLRKRLFIRYWANEKTFMNPLGSSVLKGQEDTQDEINWVLTRTAQIFQRNATPRIAINKELAAALQKNMIKLYGQKAANAKIDHRDLEITTMDDNGNSMEIIQIDITKIGDITWVKELIKIVLMETQTSEKAVDFYMDKGSNASAQSGIAKFYDLFISLMKAEFIQGEYITFLQNLIRDCTWLANLDDPAVRIEKPEVKIKSMIPVQRKEAIEENMLALGAGKSAQSLETTIVNINPGKTEEWFEEEQARIEAEKAAAMAVAVPGARQTLESMMDNKPNRIKAGAATPPAAPKPAKE